MTIEELRREARRLSANDVLGELLALSIVEFTMTPGVSITTELAPSRGSISDTGRGISLTPDAGDTISHAERAFTTFYPCPAKDPDVDRVLRELIWGPRGPLGPALPNLACPSLEFTSRRGGEVWSQKYRYGEAATPASMIARGGATGTTIHFETGAPLDRGVIANLIDRLHARIPRLHIALLTAD